MRLYHQLYRRKNPSKPRALSGARKDVYDDLMSLMPVRNPADGSIRGRPGARIARGEALTPGIVTGAGPRMTQTLKKQRATEAALARLERMEEEAQREEEIRELREVTRPKKRKRSFREERERAALVKVGKTEPLRRALLRQAAARELASGEEWRKEKGLPARSKAAQAQRVEEVASGVSAKWNLLAELNRRIAKGRKALIPLRNTVRAELEGRLEGPQLDYTVKEALAELTAAEIRGIKKILAETRVRGEPVRGEGFVARRVMTPKDLFGSLSRAQLTAVKQEIRKRGLSKFDKQIIAKDPQVQQAFLKQLKIPISRYELGRFLKSEDPKEISILIASAVGKDPEVVKALGKMELFDRIRAHVADLPEVRMAKEKLRRAEAQEAAALETVRKSIVRERMAGGTLGSKQPIVLESEGIARQESKEYAKTVAPKAMAAEREREIPKDDVLWDRVSDRLAKKAKKLEGEDKKRGRKIEKVIKDHEAILKKYKSVKKLRILPYVPPSFFKGLMAPASMDMAAQTERDRLVFFYDEDAKAALKRFQDQVPKAKVKTVAQYRQHLLDIFRARAKIDTGNYPQIKTVAQYRDYLARRLYDSVDRRWRNMLMRIYEAHGGRYLTAAERRTRERALKKELGSAFPMGGGIHGIIEKANGKYKWKLFDSDGAAMMWSEESTHAVASRQIGKAHRITLNLFREAFEREPGFDHLPESDRKWLSSNKPEISLSIKKILWASAGELRDVDAKTLRWLAAKEILEEPMAIKIEGYTKASDCKGMKPGEKRAVPGKGFTIFVERGRSKTKRTYNFVVLTKDGDKSAKYRVPECKTVIARANLVAGALKAGKKIVATASNPASLKRLENTARKYFRKKNPFGGVKLPRKAAQVGSIEDLSGMIGLPDSAEEAYRLGYYAGIIKGIDTCGVQNYMRRRALRKEFQQRLLDAVVLQQETLTEPARRGRRGTTDEGKFM